jgi:hypothetical protein
MNVASSVNNQPESLDLASPQTAPMNHGLYRWFSVRYLVGPAMRGIELAGLSSTCHRRLKEAYRVVNRNIEDAIYDKVAEELANGEIQSGLMAKATAKSRGDSGLAQSLYIELRAEQLARQLKSTGRALRKRHNPQGQAERPDTPLHTFALKSSEGMFGTKYRLTVRERTLCFLNLKTREDLIFDPQSGDYGIKLSGGAFSSGFRITLINGKGDHLVFRTDPKAVKTIKVWLRKRKRR